MATDAELEALLAMIESDRAERKETLRGDAPEKCRQAICAFANDLPNHRQPGYLFIGVRDNGESAGVAITDELLRQLADMRSDGQILPLPSIAVEKRSLRGRDVAVVTVLPSDTPPVRYSGRVWIRTGPRRAVANAQDERILNEKRRHRDLPFDVHPVPSATIADLDKRLFADEYLPSIVARDVLDANNRTYEERLSACRMIESADTPTPTVTALLVLAPRVRDFIPCAYIQFLRIDGDSLADPIIDEESIDGPLSQMLRRIDEKIEAHIRTAVDFVSGATERRTPDFPFAALQQLVRNAVMHRTYESTNAPVRVSWFSDRVEILSPGGPYGLVTKENFGRPGFTDYRNPTLAESMKALGFVQRFGAGIPTAIKRLAENANPPPIFDAQDKFVLVTIRKRQ